MLFKTRGIVFRFTKYGESSIIVNIFTEQFGLQGYIVNSVRSKTGKGKIALYQPLTLLDLVVYHRENANIMRIKEAKCLYLYQTLSHHMHKTTIALFIGELLNKTVKEQSHAGELCSFLIDSLIQLDQIEKAENFHLIFLVKLSRHLGFQPQNTLEALDGRLMGIAEEQVLARLLQADYSTPISMSHIQRRAMLDALLQFYSVHVENFGKMRSLNVLREVLG